MKKALTILLCVPLFNIAYGASVVNGSMTDTGGDYNVFNTLVPSGWSNNSTTFGPMGTPDIFDENTNFGSFAWSASSDGGTFVHALAFSASDEGIAQTIADLIIGQDYAVSFEQSISTQSAGRVGNAGVWDVTFGAQTLTSASMITPSASTPFGWQDQTLVFTATATTQELVFFADQATGNSSIRVDLGLDGVTLTAIPIPTAIWLFGSALGLLGWIQRKTA